MRIRYMAAMSVLSLAHKATRLCKGRLQFNFEKTYTGEVLTEKSGLGFSPILEKTVPTFCSPLNEM